MSSSEQKTTVFGQSGAAGPASMKEAALQMYGPLLEVCKVGDKILFRIDQWTVEEVDAKGQPSVITNEVIRRHRCGSGGYD